ncbi:efflux RND transporter periplasmic adaptor subunit [Desulfallas thermosapovorans]|uniref:Cobalt-zinc-cadmium efflux system membrane fusion protein n=1 Tax=Desulfallas thermosapovorans DSM 6562 TaxID=1121431 RepID=A0A5S4ZWU9_9FIRM|nr:efflux RND transporter periplasmic adaptor subunit [Desulfallas thermosapovorans]TYO96583.1 cobalt-zinc-cadmium efflux system membrane fusion protein [Desulfallas thermosapovorans DSM 6562]
MSQLTSREGRVRIKRKVIYLLISLLVISFSLAGCGGQDKPNTEQEETVVPVQTAAVERGVINDTIVVTGKLEAIATSNVVPSGPGGKVLAVNVEVGSQVSKGQTLITLENPSEASLAAAIHQAEQGVAQAQSNLEIARINFEQAAANYERGKQLYDAGAIPQAGQAGFETVYEIPYKQAKVNYEQVAPAALASAEAAVAAARERYQEQQNNSLIKSPISGVVTAVNVNPGELASPAAQAPVVTVVNLSKVEVKTNVTESQINKIKQGQEVPVLISAVSAEPFTGVITNIALAADPATKAYPIKVQIDNAQHVLKPGMFAEVQIDNPLQETLLVPREAVVKSGDTDVVWLVNGDRVTTREVTVGASDGQKIQVLEGLEVGEQVVVSGQNVLKDNAKVEIKSQVK